MTVTTPWPALLQGLGHPARVAILRHLVRVDKCICGEIVNILPLAQSTVSQHLKQLRAGLIRAKSKVRVSVTAWIRTVWPNSKTSSRTSEPWLPNPFHGRALSAISGHAGRARVPRPPAEAPPPAPGAGVDDLPGYRVEPYVIGFLYTSGGRIRAWRHGPIHGIGSEPVAPAWAWTATATPSIRASTPSSTPSLIPRSQSRPTTN